MRIRAFVLSTFTLAIGLASARTLAAPKPPACEVKANASGGQTVDETILSGGQRAPNTVQLNASPSQDASTYTWAQSATDAFQVTLSNVHAVKPTFAAPNVGPSGATLNFTLTVTGCDPVQTASDTTTVIIRNVNGPPVASIAVTPSTTVREGDRFTLDGRGSTDPDGDPLTYRWEQLVAGGGATVVGTGSTVTLTAPEVPYPGGASFSYRLTVSDGTLTNATTTAITVQWVNQPPVARAACTSPVNEGAAVVLDALPQGNPSTDPDDGIAAYAWRQVAGGPDANLPAAALAYSGFSFDAPSLVAGHGDTMTFEVKVTDVGGLFSTAQCSVLVKDVTKPVLAPANVTREATSGAGADVDYRVIATDAYDGDVAVSCVPASGSTFQLGSTPVSCSAADHAGNLASATFTVFVVDSTPPEVTVPADLAAEATSGAGAPVTFTASASDLVDGSLTPRCVPASGSTFPVGATTVRCTATDSSGNEGAGTFKVTVGDSTPPDLTAPADLKVEATSPAGAAATFAASAHDAVDGDLTPTCTPASGDAFPLGKTTVTCKAIDAHGNAASKTFDVTVEDTTAPELVVPGELKVEATGPQGAVATFAASAHDAVDGDVTPACTPASGETFPFGKTTVTCKATDAHGNAANKTFDVVVEDTTPPEVKVPASLTVEATGPSGAEVTFSASAHDLVDGDVTPACAPASGATFAIGKTTVTCTATDAHKNAASKTFDVTVQDTTPPAVTVPTAPIIAEATGPAGAVVSFVASAHDLVDGDVTPVCVPASGTTFALGPTTVTCTAIDAHKNSATKSFEVRVQDTTPPALTVPATVTAEATGPSGAAVSFTVTASDTVDGIVKPSCSPASGATFALGKTSVTCTATDAHGNAASKAFDVVVQDTTAPALTLPQPIVAEATGASGAVVKFTAAASDVVDGAVTPSCTPASGATFALGATTVTCTATDAHANTATGTFTVTVRDTTPPAVTISGDLSAYATSAAGAVVTYTTSAADIVDGNVDPKCSPASGATFPLGGTTVTCTATDAHANTASASFKVTVTYAWGSWLPPISLDGRAAFKIGSTIPVKFALGGASAGVTNAIAKLYVARVSSQALGDEMQVASTNVGDLGNQFRYDGASYIFNWSTKGLPVGTWTLYVDLGDGAARELRTITISTK